MRAAVLLALCACASQSTGGQVVRADISTSQTVKDEGRWKVKVKFGPPAAPGSPSTAREPRAAQPQPRDIPPWMVFPADFDHGPVTEAEFSGKLPTTTTTLGSTHLDWSSWFQKAWKFGFSLWPWIIGAAVLAGLALLAWKLKPPWMDWLWKLLRLVK